MSQVNNAFVESLADISTDGSEDLGLTYTVIASAGRFLVFVEASDRAESQELSRALATGEKSDDWVQIIVTPPGSVVLRDRPMG